VARRRHLCPDTRQPPGDDLRRGGERQRRRAHRNGGRIGQQAGERRVGVRLEPPHCAGEEDADPLEAGGQVRQPPERGDVGPVQVVDGEHKRAPLGQVDRQPVEAVEDGEGALVVGEVGGRHRSRPEQGGGERGGTLEGRLAVLCARTRDDRLEELAYDAERERPLELPAAGRQDGDASRVGPLAELPEQRRLADPRRTLDHREAARPGDERRVQRLDLQLTF
jgi:hypothetical protein